MNEYQFTLYMRLMDLVANNEAFYFQDFNLDGRTYRIFNYRLASYTEFQKPGALECRGHMFEVDTEGNAIRLAALPMQKFFNLNENPSTIGLDLSQVDEILLKADGSLMSTYVHAAAGKTAQLLRLKSKGSLFSEQALAAMDWLYNNESTFQRDLGILTRRGYTVNMEWCSPIHRIVIGYETPHLKVLNVRSNLDGTYMPYADVVDYFGRNNVIDRCEVDDPVKFVSSIPSMTEDIEGYIVRLGSGQLVKIKTDKYLSLHHAKDSVNNPRRLFEAILDEGIDDLRSMFYTDVVAMHMIDDMQDKVDRLYNHMVKVVEEFYVANKHLDRKDYAIKGRADVDNLYFGMVMNKYLNKPVDYKGFMKSKYKELGIRDTQLEEVN